MALQAANAGSIILSSLFNGNTVWLLKGNSGYEDAIQLGDWVPGTLALQPNQALASGAMTELFQIKQQGGARQFAVTATGGVIAQGVATVGALDVPGNVYVGGTSQLNGRVGVEASPNTGVQLWIGGNLVADTTGAQQYGLLVQPMFPISATQYAVDIGAQFETANAVGTIPAGYGVRVFSPSLGASSNVTALYGLEIDTQSGATGSNYALYTNSGPVRLGDTTNVDANLAVASQATVQSLITNDSASVAGNLAVASQAKVQNLVSVGSASIGGRINAPSVGSSSKQLLNFVPLNPPTVNVLSGLASTVGVPFKTQGCPSTAVAIVGNIVVQAGIGSEFFLYQANNPNFQIAQVVTALASPNQACGNFIGTCLGGSSTMNGLLYDFVSSAAGWSVTVYFNGYYEPA